MENENKTEQLLNETKNSEEMIEEEKKISSKSIEKNSNLEKPKLDSLNEADKPKLDSSLLNISSSSLLNGDQNKTNNEKPDEKKLSVEINKKLKINVNKSKSFEKSSKNEKKDKDSKKVLVESKLNLKRVNVVALQKNTKKNPILAKKATFKANDKKLPIQLQNSLKEISKVAIEKLKEEKENSKTTKITFKACGCCKQPIEPSAKSRILGCTHKFHEGCLSWENIKKKGCPVCNSSLEFNVSKNKPNDKIKAN